MSHENGRIALVAPRYGESVVGGAETLCRLLAENLAAHGTQVDVLTTCAVNHFTWADALPAGTTHERGVDVHRFAVGPRDTDRFHARHGAIDLGAHLDYGEQVEWMANSAWSPDLILAAERYDWVIAMPYLFGTTFWSTVVDPDRTILIPCLHDEAHAHQAVVLDSLAAAQGLMLNAAGEQTLVERLLAGHRGGTTPRNAPAIVGCGFDEVPIPDAAAVDAFCRSHDVAPGYLLYAGRREVAKGLGTLFDYYRLYRESVPNPRPLALMGSGDLTPPRDLASNIVDLGFVPLANRATAYAGAGLLVQPSRLESFGMVVFEAWLAGTPVLVNAESDVLREHCAISSGGLWYSDAPSFVEATAMITERPHLAQALADAGREYTLTEFRWDAVRQRFHDALGAWAK